MQRRAFLAALGSVSLMSASWLAGCGIAGGGGISQGLSNVHAYLAVNFSTGQGTIIPPGTALLRVQGYDKEGAVVYGPVDMAPPADDKLNITLPTSVTVFEVFALSAVQVPV